MTAPGQRLNGAALSVAHAFDIEAAKTRLAADGGYEIIHESAGLEIGVYVLVAPEPDHQQPHVGDEVYVVLEGRGTLDVEGARVDLREGHAVFGRWCQARVRRLRAVERARDLRARRTMSQMATTPNRDRIGLLDAHWRVARGPRGPTPSETRARSPVLRRRPGALTGCLATSTPIGRRSTSENQGRTSRQPRFRSRRTARGRSPKEWSSCSCRFRSWRRSPAPRPRCR